MATLSRGYNFLCSLHYKVIFFCMLVKQATRLILISTKCDSIKWTFTNLADKERITQYQPFMLRLRVSRDSPSRRIYAIGSIYLDSALNAQQTTFKIRVSL